VSKRVTVIPGDDAAPEAVLASVDVLQAMQLDIDYRVLPSGEDGLARYGESFTRVVHQAIDEADTVLFGAMSTKTPGITHLRWGKGTYANVRPVRYFPGARSPLKDPDGIDYVIVRENLEDLYVFVEGDLGALAGLGLVSRVTRQPPPSAGGAFALKVITEANTRRLAHFACELALRRRTQGFAGKVTVASKWNALAQTDGLFRKVVAETVREYGQLTYEEWLIDDFARRLVASPQQLDVVVLPNLYGDILSDEAAATIGGLGLAPSGCYGNGFAYFESAHGSAPDIAGKHVINPVATLLSAAMMLEYLGLPADGQRLVRAIEALYRDGATLTPDQGGSASTEDFCAAVRDRLTLAV
jgi:isocitrate/isopropylmalate dehydrogenase